MIGENLKRYREDEGLGINELSRISGVNASYISALERGVKDNPSPKILEKLADALKIELANFYKEHDSFSTEESTEKYNDKVIPDEFSTPEDAIKFILEQNVIMGFGGFDINKMSDEEVLEFANELLNQLRLISYKYKK